MITRMVFLRYVAKTQRDLIVEVCNPKDDCTYSLCIPAERRHEIPSLLTSGKDSFVVSSMHGKLMFHEFDASKCIYIVNPYRNGVQKPCLVFDFVDQDVVLDTLVAMYNLRPYQYTRTVRNVLFKDPNKTQLSFTVVKKTELGRIDASPRQLSISATV